MLLTFRTVGGVLVLHLLFFPVPQQQQRRRTTTTTTAGVVTAFRLLHNQSTTGHAGQHLWLLRRGQRGQRGGRRKASLHVRQEEEEDDTDDNDRSMNTNQDEEQRQRKNNEEEESRYYDPQQQQPQQQQQQQQQNTHNYYNPDRAVNIVSELKSTAALFGAFAFGSLNLPNTLTVSESKVTSVTTSLSVSRPIPDSSLIKTFVVLDVTTLCCMISCIATSQLLIYKLTDGSYEDSIDSDLARDRSSTRRDRTRNERGEISEKDRDTEDRNTTAFVTRARDGTTNNTNPTQQHRRRHQRRDSRYTALGRLVTTYRNEFTVARLTFDVGLITLLLAVGVRSIAIFDQEIIVPIAVVIGSTSLFLIVAYCTTYVEVIRTAENSRRPTSTRNANANTKTNTVTTRNKNKNNTSMDTAKQDDSKRKNNRFGAASSNILVPISLFAIGLALCCMIVLRGEGEGEGFESTGLSSSLPWLSSFSSSSSSSSSLPSEFNFLSRFGGQQPRLPNYFDDATTSSGATKLKVVTDKLDSEKVKLVDNERNKQQQQQQQQRNNNDKKKKEYINSSRRRARIAATTTPPTPTDRRKTEVIEANRKKSAAAAASAEDEARKKAGAVLEEEETMTREEK